MPAGRTRPTKPSRSCARRSSTGRTTGRTASTSSAWLRDDGQPGFNTNTGRMRAVQHPVRGRGASIRCRTTRSRLRSPSPRRSCSRSTRTCSPPAPARGSTSTPKQRHGAASARVASRSAGRPASRHGRQDRASSEGDWIWVENHARQAASSACASTRRSKTDTVRAEHGWWFPEQEGAEPNLFGVFDSQHQQPHGCRA